MKLQKCIACGKEKSSDAFRVITSNKASLRKICRVCDNARQRERDLIRNFGITIVQFYAMLKAQNGCCAICNKEFIEGKDTHVDHCHKTLKVRGLLCHKCNSAIGYFDDNSELLERAASYLKGQLWNREKSS